MIEVGLRAEGRLLFGGFAHSLTKMGLVSIFFSSYVLIRNVFFYLIRNGYTPQLVLYFFFLGNSQFIKIQ